MRIRLIALSAVAGVVLLQACESGSPASPKIQTQRRFPPLA